MFMASAIPSSERGGELRNGWRIVETRTDPLACGIKLRDYSDAWYDITIHYGELGENGSHGKAILADAFRSMADELDPDGALPPFHDIDITTG